MKKMHQNIIAMVMGFIFSFVVVMVPFPYVIHFLLDIGGMILLAFGMFRFWSGSQLKKIILTIVGILVVRYVIIASLHLGIVAIFFPEKLAF